MGKPWPKNSWPCLAPKALLPFLLFCFCFSLFSFLLFLLLSFLFLWQSAISQESLLCPAPHPPCSSTATRLAQLVTTPGHPCHCPLLCKEHAQRETSVSVLTRDSTQDLSLHMSCSQREVRHRERAVLQCTSLLPFWSLQFGQGFFGDIQSCRWMVSDLVPKPGQLPALTELPANRNLHPRSRPPRTVHL